MDNMQTKIDYLKQDIKTLNEKLDRLIAAVARLDGMLTERGRWEARLICECEER